MRSQIKSDYLGSAFPSCSNDSSYITAHPRGSSCLPNWRLCARWRDSVRPNPLFTTANAVFGRGYAAALHVLLEEHGGSRSLEIEPNNTGNRCGFPGCSGGI